MINGLLNFKIHTMPSEKMKYIMQRANAVQVMRSDIELSPLKMEIETIFNPRNIDEDCDAIARLLWPYRDRIRSLMDEGKYHDAFTLFYEILESLSYHFVKDEHYDHFDDMYSPDYTCADMMRDIITKVKAGVVPEADRQYLSDMMDRIADMEAYDEYGSPFAISDWLRR